MLLGEDGGMLVGGEGRRILCISSGGHGRTISLLQGMLARLLFSCRSLFVCCEK